MSRGRRQHAAISAIVVAASTLSTAHAGGLVVTDGSPRAIGRAGTGTVGDDGGGALLVNPAALARRDTRRAQVGLAIVDDAVDWRASSTSIVERDQAGSRAAPLVAAAGAVGNFVIGAAAITSAVSARALASPVGLAPDQLGSAFDARYAGLVGALRRDTVTIGAARRLGDSVAIGVSIAGSRVSVAEERRLWAGMAPRDTVGDPQNDVDVAMTAQDGLAPSAVAGIMIAPTDTRLELGASVAWAATAHAAGSVVAAGTDGGPSIASTAPSASLDIAQPWTFRAGARWLGDHWNAELDGDLWLFSASAATMAWQLRDVRVVDPSGTGADLLTVPSRISAQTHGAVRASVDVEIIAGLLWATAGYAFTSAGTSAARMSPTFGDLAGHTVALGIEGTAGGFTLTLGWARTWELASSSPTALALDNPFGGGAGNASAPAGRYDGSIDQIGVLLDVELDAPQ